MAVFEVLSPWAEADPVPVRGIAERPSTLAGKRIGLFSNGKRAAPLILEYVERELKARWPGATFSRFEYPTNNAIADNEEEWPKFQEWVRGVDAVIGAVGD